MGIQIQGAGGSLAEVDASARALRLSRRPREFGALGSYRKGLLSGTMAAGLAGGSDIFQMRWTDATRLALVHRVILDGLGGSATAFTAGFGFIAAFIARAWTVDGSGGTSGTLTGNNSKLRTSMGTPLLSAIRCATTAALVPGTRTPDSQEFGHYSMTFGTATSVQYANQVVLFDESATDMPIVLAANEGIFLSAGVPATGTWQFGVTVEWSEVNAF